VQQWQDELETIKQTGTVEEYANRFIDLAHKVDPEEEYPDEYKLRLFKKGLKPEIRKWVNLNADNTIDSVIEMAKKIEETEYDPVEQTYHQTQTQTTPEWDALAKVLQDLTSRLDRVETGRRYNNKNNNGGQQQNQQNN
jgi:hypothetical protein